MVIFFDESHARIDRPQRDRLLKIVFFTLLRGLHGGGAADRRRLPRHRHGGDAGRHGLSADRPLSAPARRSAVAHRRGRRASSAPISATFSTAPPAASSSRCRRCCSSPPSIFAPKHGVLRGARRAAAAPAADGGAASMSTLIGFRRRAAELRLHAARAGRRRAGRRGLRRAVLLSRAQGLVADGRRHLARGAAGHRARPLCSACRWRSAPSRPGSAARCRPATSRRTAA